MARITPAAKSEWSPDLVGFLGEFRSSVLGDTPADTHPAGANLLGTLARYPALAKAFLSFNGHLLYGSTLGDRQRELLILRVAAVRQCDYEWAQHAILAEIAGMPQAEIERVAAAVPDDEWAAADRALLIATDELLSDGAVAARTWEILAAEFERNQLMDIVFTVGTYDMLAMALRSFGVEPDDDLKPYLPRHR
ncbi:alkylhydroperoxidase family enzyme [Nocardia kruczakiae]|uniref:Alkylhydroperoxidase family enzyme n=1 Tax=Nocardia kruczakiae TaxID=261477 RepID=A0ABU1X7A7_9NOCA|nr:carboxymuconolactone decarboxylase family protein [Nocardia kruczakiae]MDR7166428.1 alkylhydroperoxidase family enzyme [Nocardia kruczakiae]